MFYDWWQFQYFPIIRVVEMLSNILTYFKDYLWPPLPEQHREPGVASHPLSQLDSKEDDFPTAAIFLDCAWQPRDQKLPPQLRDNQKSGLKLCNPKYWIHVDLPEFEKEIAIVNRIAADDFNARDKIYVPSDESRLAEQELLDMIIDNLKEHHQEYFAVEVTGDNDILITQKITGQSYLKSDYYENKPLILAKKLVQEDFIILTKNNEGWCFTSGIACFSFTFIGLRGEKGFMNPGNSLAKIHTPVPNFKEKIHPTLHNLFDGRIGDKIFWRATTLIVLNEGLTPFANDDQGDAAIFETKRTEDIPESELAEAPIVTVSEANGLEDLAIITEYQTVRRLPKTGAICLGVHSYISPLENLKKAPRAADVMLRSMDSMSARTLKYRDLDNPTTKNMIKDFLSSIANHLQ